MEDVPEQHGPSDEMNIPPSKRRRLDPPKSGDAPDVMVEGAEESEDNVGALERDDMPSESEESEDELDEEMEAEEEDATYIARRDVYGDNIVPTDSAELAETKAMRQAKDATSSSGAYVPPALRATQLEMNSEELKVQRMVKRQLNKYKNPLERKSRTTFLLTSVR